MEGRPFERLLCHPKKRWRWRLRAKGKRDKKKKKWDGELEGRAIDLRLNKRLKWWVGHSQMKSQMDFCLRGGTTTIRHHLRRGLA